MPDPTPTPDAASLHEAALRHLSRYACSVAGLVRVLDRRVQRWAREAAAAPEQHAAARAAVRQVATRLAEAGMLDDSAFAAGRARSLARAGRSRHAISAHLTARGVDAAVAAQVLPSDPDHELAAALTLARRRRIGPFRRVGEADAEQRRRELAAMARGGFSEAVARQALDLDTEIAEEMLVRLRRDG